MAWEARFPGVCQECRSGVVVGQVIDWAVSTGVRHVTCPDPLAADHPPCPDCFLVHPPGTCDR